MTLTQILQKIRAVFYTRAEIDSMGGGTSLDTTIGSKQNALSTAQLSAVNSGITSNKVSQYDEYINGASGQPVGTISWVMGSTVPAGYLICNGSAVSRTAYDKLFQAIGTKYGEGDGSTTFNLPNLIGKFLQGDVISGTTGGEATHTLTIDEMPTHSHRINQYKGANCGYIPAGRDAHSIQVRTDVNGIANQGGVFTDRTASYYESAFLEYTGGSNAHNNLPPYITSIPCIKAFDSVIDATTVSVAQLSDTKVNKSGDTMTGSLTAPSFVANGIDCSVDSQGAGWIRYSNGFQICWGEYGRTTATEATINFPKTFIGHGPASTCPLSVSVSGQSSTIYAYGWTDTHVVILGSNMGSFTYTAIGRWK